MPPPTWIPGQVLVASDVNNWFVTLAGYKTAGTTRSTVSLTADPDLGFGVLANAFYEVRAGIGYNCAANGINFNFLVPAGTTGSYEVAGQLGGPAAVTNSWTVPLAASSSTTGGLLFHGILATGVNAGGLNFAWASSTGASTLTVNAYSYLTANRVG